MKSIYALIAELALAGIASAHGVPVLRSQACYSAPVQAVYAPALAVYTPPAQIIVPPPVVYQPPAQLLYSAPAQIQSYGCAAQLQSYSSGSFRQSFAVRERVIVPPQRVFQRSVTRTRTIVR